MTEEAEPEPIERGKSKHVGKWIGLRGTHVVTVSDTHEEVLAKLKREGIDGVYVFYSPTEEEKQYGFLFWQRECELERKLVSILCPLSLSRFACDQAVYEGFDIRVFACFKRGQ